MRLHYSIGCVVPFYSTSSIYTVLQVEGILRLFSLDSLCLGLSYLLFLHITYIDNFGFPLPSVTLIKSPVRVALTEE
jgi:hypothetical protein